MTRLLARPEIGAFIAAVVIYIFFFIVAPAFRSPEAFSTMLYASLARSASSRSGSGC